MPLTPFSTSFLALSADNQIRYIVEQSSIQSSANFTEILTIAHRLQDDVIDATCAWARVIEADIRDSLLAYLRNIDNNTNIRILLLSILVDELNVDNITSLVTLYLNPRDDILEPHLADACRLAFPIAIPIALSFTNDLKHHARIKQLLYEIGQERVFQVCETFTPSATSKALLDQWFS